MKLGRFTSTMSCLAIFAASNVAWALDVPAAADAQVVQGSPAAGYNYGGNVNLVVDSTANAQNYSYIRFDPASYLPPGYTANNVTQALLRLYVNTVTTGGSFSLTSAPTSWSEGTANGAAQSGTITWTGQPAAGSAVTQNGTAITNVLVATTNLYDFITIDITDAVKGWISNPTTNYGFVLKPSPAGNFRFDSKENNLTAHGPWLDITLSTARVHPGGDITMGTFTNGPTP